MSIYETGMSPEEYMTDSLRESIEFDGVREDVVRHHFVRRNMIDANNIDKDIYDSESFYAEDGKEPTDMFEYSLDDDIYVELLKHVYTNESYEYRTMGEELPHVNMPWRNAISFLGRIIRNGVLVYKGIIILQYDGEKHHIVVQKPYQVNYGTFSSEDPLSISYNALDPLPFIFEDKINDEADNFSYPTVLGVIPYNMPFEIPYPGAEAKKAKTFSTFDKYQLMFLRPYFAIPVMPQFQTQNDETHDLFKITLRIKLYSGHEGYEYVLSQSINSNGEVYIDWDSPDLTAFLYRVYDLSQSHNEVIRASLITEVINNVEIVSEDTEKVPMDSDNSGDTMLDTSEIMHNLANTEDPDDPLEYSIDVSTHTEMISESNEVYEYRSDVTISRRVPIYDDDGEVESYETRETTNTKVWTSDDQTTTIQLVTNFEGIRFITNLADLVDTTYDVFNYSTTVTVDAELSDRHVSTGTTQPIMLRGEKLVDPDEMLKQHKLERATLLTNMDRFLILYGRHVGSNVLQFLEYDKPSHAPFPFGAIDFDGEIIHAHPHRGMLYVFTTSGLWIVQMGIDYTELQKTFAYANVVLDPSEKHTVESLGNEVFFVSKNKGYVIRTNINVESQDDVYVQAVTSPINDLLNNPKNYLLTRLEQGYGKPMHIDDNLRVHYYTRVMNSELYIFASYYNDEGLNAMVTYIFDKDNKRWRMYDTLAGSYPVSTLVSGGSKGFDLLLKNHPEDSYITYAGYLTRLPDNQLERRLGDIKVLEHGEDQAQYDLIDREEGLPMYSIMPISLMMDTGALAFSARHSKKVRRISMDLMDLGGNQLDFYIIPHMDYLDYQNRLEVSTYIDDSGERVPNYIENINSLGYSDIMAMITPQNMPQDGYRASLPRLQTTRKLNIDLQMNAKGKLPGFRLYMFINDQVKIGSYGITYRQQKAR